jgi:hypothetical protein
MTSQFKSQGEPTPHLDLQPMTQDAIEHFMQILDKWIADESGYEEETWSDLKTALNRERDQVNARRMFIE